MGSSTVSTATKGESPPLAVFAAILIALALLGIRTKLETFGPFNRLHSLGLALCALQFQDNLFCRLGFLVEDWFRLATKPSLLLVITPFPLGCLGRFSCLVLRNLVGRVLLAFPAECILVFWDVHH